MGPDTGIRQPRIELHDALERFRAGGYWRPMRVAAIMGWSRSYIYWHIARGDLRAERIGPRVLRIHGQEVVRFLSGLASGDR
ncbi:MAG: hypothetical protein AB1824_01350 [Acidobacteriota bacterium]